MMLLVLGFPNNPRPPVHPLPLRAPAPVLERIETDGARYGEEANPMGMSDSDEKRCDESSLGPAYDRGFDPSNSAECSSGFCGVPSASTLANNAMDALAADGGGPV
jgi:hypothetical protein